ncbi:hypothetical protein COOONC_07178, partial [Cooperia oncophora]
MQCFEKNWNVPTQSVRQHDFRQVIFAVENSAAMSSAASNLATAVSSMINQLERRYYPSVRQYSLIEYDDRNVRIISSTFWWEDFLNQFTSSMTVVTSNKRAINQSLSLDAYEISILSPITLYLFTSTQLSVHTNTDSKPLSKEMQVNVFTLGDGTALPSGDLTFHQRETGGRNIPITNNSIVNLTPLLISSLQENSLIMDEAA